MTEIPDFGTDRSDEIKTTPNLNVEKGIDMALEDGNFSGKELNALKTRFKKENLRIYSNYLKEKINIKNKNKYHKFYEEYNKYSRNIGLLNAFEMPGIYDKPYAKKLLLMQNFTSFDYFDKFKDKPYARDILLKNVEKYPANVFLIFDKFKNMPYAKEILLKAIDNSINSYNVFDDYIFAKIKDAPYTKEVLLKTAEKFPYMIIIDYPLLRKKIKKAPYYKEILARANDKNVLLKYAQTDPFSTFRNHLLIKDKNTVKEILVSAKNKDILLKATVKDSRAAFYYFEFFKKEPYAREILLKAAEKDPFAAFYYFEFFKKEPYAREILLKAAELINKDGSSEAYLRIGQIINSLHNEKEDIRFVIIEKFNENKLYNIITNGRAEIFMSTYNGIIERLLPKLKSSGKDIYDLARGFNFEGLTTFIEAAASYGKINILFDTIKSDNKKRELIDKIFYETNMKRALESNKTGYMDNYIAIIEIINNLPKGNLLDYIGAKVKVNYEEGNNKDAWGIIAKFCANKFDNNLFAKIPDEYKLPELKGIKSKELFDSKGRNIQQYFFYNDEDGKNSYANFLSSYRGESGWIIQENKSQGFISISKKINNKEIKIFANLPENDCDNKKVCGVESISNEMNKIVPPLESIVIVHRGHSYHAEKTIAHIPKIAKMVFLGSCGGFQNMGKVLDKSKNAHIISTKGIGTKTVNDTLFKAINEQILSGKDIIWEDIWKKVSPILKNNLDFQFYVRPDQNLGTLFYKKYMKLSNNN